MKTVERILIKVAMIQLLFLLLFQLVFHRIHAFSNMNHLSQFEGVNGKTYSRILEVFSSK